MTLRFFFGIHSIPPTHVLDVVAGGIVTVTQLHVQPPWILGPKFPATHAFVAWEHSDGSRYRLDGQPPQAKISRFDVRGPTALWELHGDERVQRAWERAVDLDGTPYDQLEGLAQIIPGVAMSAWMAGATICTGLAIDVMHRAGVAFVLPNRLPERWGQELQRLAALGVLVPVDPDLARI